MYLVRRQPAVLERAGTAGDASAAYRREARRLRHRFRNDPARLHHSLRRLSQGDDAIVPAAEPREDGPANVLAREVGRHLDGTVLRYSNRMALLRFAKGLGIGRFEANLIIAAVQHKARAAEPKPTAKGNRLVAAVAVAFVVEVLIVVGAWVALGA